MALHDIPVSHRAKLSSLWAALTLCYIYCDYFELYQPGKLQGILEGRFGPLGPTTQAALIAASAMLAVPVLMIALCNLLPATQCRLFNIGLGLVYTGIMALVLLLPGSWYFYKLYALVEIAVSMFIAWLAYKWPRQ